MMEVKMKTMENIEELLRRKGLKVTDKRVGLMMLVKQAATPLSAEDIHMSLKAQHDALNLSSVYRNLEILCAAGLILRTTDYEGKRALYQDASNTHQHAIVCIGCNMVIPIHECPLEEFQRRHSDLNRFKVVSHRIEIFGYCDHCQTIGS